MDLFVRLLPLLKLVLVFIAMLAGIRRLGLSLSILLGGVVILPLYGLSPLDWPGVAAGALSDPKTLRLAVVVALIMTLSDLMESTGQTARLMRALAPRLRNPRLRLAFFPALIGLLPMPGGAIFSAPMVKGVAEGMGVGAEEKVLVNYWFRHVWETAWPLYPGVILAASLTQIPMTGLILRTAPVSLVCALLGWRFFLRPKALAIAAPAPSAGPTEEPHGASALEILRLGLPLAAATLGAIAVELVLSAFVEDAPFEWAVIIALAAACVLCVAQNRLSPAKAATALRGRHLLRMMGVVAAIFIFKDAIQATGLVRQLAELAGGDAALAAAAVFLPFLVGFVSGITMAFVGATVPLLLDLLNVLGRGGEVVPFTVLALVSGFTGIMASPLHICFIFSCEYFGVDAARAWRRLLAPSALLFLAGLGLFFLYR